MGGLEPAGERLSRSPKKATASPPSGGGVRVEGRPLHGCAPSPGLHAGPPLSADQDAQRQGELAPHPLPAGPTVSPQPSFPRLTFPRLWGLAECLSPNLRVQASPSSSIPSCHQVLCLQTVPARPPGSARDQGPPSGASVL